MADYRIPGSLDNSRGSRDVRDGTLQRTPGVTPGFINGPVPGNASSWGWFDLDDRVGDLIDALNIGKANTLAAVKRMTDQALDDLIRALLPGLLTMIAVIGITTVVGGAIGALVGALVGAGVGAAPGAAVGVELGLSIGGTLLTWMGLGFLLVAIGEGLGELSARVAGATSRAWNAVDSRDRSAEVHRAGLEFADAVALLFKIILMAIVARLTLNQGKAASKETFELLRKSRLGEQFAEWVMKNQEALIRNPKLQPSKPKASQGEAPVKPAETPSQAKARAKKEEAAKAERALEQKKVPCFHPYDKKKFTNLTKDQQQDYLKEMADQLKRQQDQINDMTAAQYKAARDAFGKYGRNPMAEGAQAGYREDFAADVALSITNSLRAGGMGPAQADQAAELRTKEIMEKLAALHEPDMVAGGWLQPDPKGMGRADVNSSIGGSWNQGGRVQAMDSAAEDAIKAGNGDQKMNVKLEPCRGKDLR